MSVNNLKKGLILNRHKVTYKQQHKFASDLWSIGFYIAGIHIWLASPRNLWDLRAHKRTLLPFLLWWGRLSAQSASRGEERTAWFSGSPTSASMTWGGSGQHRSPNPAPQIPIQQVWGAARDLFLPSPGWCCFSEDHTSRTPTVVLLGEVNCFLGKCTPKQRFYLRSKFHVT